MLVMMNRTASPYVTHSTEHLRPEHRVGTGIMVIERLVELYEAWGKPDKVAEWRGKLEDADPLPERDRPN